LAFLFAKLFLWALRTPKKKRVVGLYAVFDDEVSLLVDFRIFCYSAKNAAFGFAKRWQKNEAGLCPAPAALPTAF